jgi:histidinol dehydrogenase
MNTIVNPQKEQWAELLQRPTQSVEDIEKSVTDIFVDIKRKGDKGIQHYTSLFDGVELETMQVSVEEFGEAEQLVSPELKEAIEIAKNNIEAFHKAQKTEKVFIETTAGVECWQEKRPIKKVGLYIPGGSAPLFSTVLMLAVPAKLAGCKDIILTSPPNSEGKINPAILYAARQCGIDKVFKVGGIQAIAGMTFGTETIPQVYKIFGPGNQYVTIAKQLATKYGVAIDMPAGPSELLVVTDASANASFVASDLLSQAEHGADSQVIMVSTSKDMITQVAEEIAIQLPDLSRRDIAESAIENSKLILVETKEIALEMINEYGPEHFIVCTDDNQFYVDGIENAGSVFIGNYTPESAGDYASGTNHTLPTNGHTKAYSGVNLDSFLKAISFQKISKEGIQNIGNSIEVLASAEGLDAHKNAVSLRLKSIKKEG